MTRPFTFQDPGEGIYEGEVVKILVDKGARVTEGQKVLEVETDKAVFEVASPFGGVVEQIHIKEGEMIHVGETLFTFSDGNGEAATPPPKTHRESPPSRRPADTSEPAEKKSATEAPKERPAKRAEQDRPKEEVERKPSQGRTPIPASPATRRVAQELGVDLRAVTPSGAEGRVLTSDVRAFAEGGAPEGGKGEPTRAKRDRPQVQTTPTEAPSLPDFSQWGQVERTPLRSLRRETAKRMALSWSQIPHVTHNDVADITELEAFRQRHVKDIETKGGKLTLTVLVMKAVVAALHRHPRFNATLDVEQEELILKRYYHLGIALDSPRGLLVPVIRDVDRKSISELAMELFQLAERVRGGDVNRDDVTGGTFTITNPGPLGGTSFTPIINYPEVAILGLGRARWQPVVQAMGDQPKIVPRLLLPISFGFDHRVNDGADAARFVNAMIETLTDLEAFTLAV
ncbi:hypothetical protein YTPLAS18_36890 [Nitrospira sp.]|nr:hypothetical protein YTPLAS18_36890 [Nitrospira sp.]